jgi:16S rRNA processing protein RimM
MTSTEELKIGRVVGIHGVRGAIKVRLDGASQDVLRVSLLVRLVPDEEDEGAAALEAKLSRVSHIPGTDRTRLWLEGVESRDAAEALRGHHIFVDRGVLPELDNDEYYLADLLGGTVVRAGDAARRSLGEIVGVTSNGMQDLLEVKWRRANGVDATWLLPALPEYIVEVEEQTVLVDLPREFLPTELEKSDEP